MSGKRKKGAGKAALRAYGRLTRHERDTVQRMLERGASCRQIARGAGQVALDGVLGGGVAQVRDRAEGEARRARGRLRRPVCGMPAPGRVAALLQRVRAVPRDRLQAPPARLLRCPRRAAVRGLGPRLVQARDRRRRARRGRGARPHPRRPGPWALARAAVRPQRRARGPVALDDLPLGRGRLRRHDQHGAQEEGRLQAEEARAGGLGHAALAPQVVRRVPRPGRGRVRRRLGDGHRRGRAGGQRLPAHAAAPPQQAAARAAAGGEDRRVRRGRPEGVQAVLGADGARRVFRAVLTDNGAEFSDEAAIAALLGEGPGETRLFYCDPRRSDQKGACERNHVEIRKLLPKGRGLRFDRLVPADLALAMSHVNSSPAAPRLRDARPRLPGDARRRRGGAAGGVRHRGRAHRRARPDAGPHRAGARREGRCPLS